jgi:hydroxymethylglutaryl-CoA synthase
VNSIAGWATYTPRYRLTREAAREAWPQLSMPGASRSVPALDEDALTMAAHASLDALAAAGVGGSQLAGITIASCSSPYVVKSGAAVVADYVGAPPSACLIDMSAGTHGGVQALVGALRDRELARRGPILVVGSDALFASATDGADLGFGAAAAAFVVAEQGFAELVDFDFGYSSYTSVWQPAGARDLRRYDDERFERHAGYAPQMAAGLSRFLSRVDRAPDLVALALPPGGRADAVLAAGEVPSDRVAGTDEVRVLGDSGCANALLSLASALEQAGPGQAVALQAYGSGAGTVSAMLELRSRPRPPASAPAPPPVELSYVQYAKHRGLLPLTTLPSAGSPYGASPGWERRKQPSVGLHAARCTSCGSLNFPPRSYCLDCRGQEFVTESLPRTASVVTFNLQFVVGIGPEEAPLPICTALIDGEQAGRYGGKVAALMTDAATETVEIGTRVELIPRRGDVEDGLVKYGWKFRPREVAA